MIYDAIEQAFVVANTGNKFTNDLTQLFTDKGLGAAGLSAAVNMYKRQRAETFIALGAQLPGLGIWGTDVQTNAKVGSGWRDNVTLIVYDYYCVYSGDADAPVKAAQQAELAAEALLKCIDALPGSGLVVFGAGELRSSVRVQMSDGYLKSKDGWFRRAKVMFPVTDRDEPV